MLFDYYITVAKKMTSRKLIKFGKNSFVISLPKEWLDKNKLGKGDTVVLDEHHSSLTIVPGAQDKVESELRTTVQTHSDNFHRIRTEIVSAYLLGYDTIVITGPHTHKMHRDIKDTVGGLAGLEIVEIGKDRIVAKEMLGLKEVDVSSTVRRIDLTVRMMIEECVPDPKGKISPNLDETDQDVNRLVFLTFRVLRSAMDDYSLQRALKMDFAQIFELWSIALRMEKIGDRTKRVSRWLGKARYNKKNHYKIKEMQKRILENYTTSMKAYYKRDKNLAMNVEEKNLELIRYLDTFLKDHDSLVTAEIVENFKSMSYSVKQIARSVINMGRPGIDE